MDIHANQETWMELLSKVKDKCGMTATLYDLEGHVILRSGEMSNDLCRMVQAHSGAVTTICAVAHKDISQEALSNEEPAIGECDLGMVKLVVPIMQDDEVIGFIGACGTREPDVEVESFLAARALELSEEELKDPLASVGVISSGVIQRAVLTIQSALRKL